MNIIVFSYADNNYRHLPFVRDFMQSFKYFHPNITLKMLYQDDLDQVFADQRLGFDNCKASLALYVHNMFGLADDDLIVCIEPDHLILGNLDGIFAGNYEVGGCYNHNQFMNTGLRIISGSQWEGTYDLVPQT